MVYKTKKDLTILFSWLLFYRWNKNAEAYKHCEQQIEDLMNKLPQDKTKILN